ncbi:endonuclease/exonuclease/phosphatase family protein [uncultured Litoreibacter sp.]|uniref:endonuclease/exonuclease/phosphatase family protein n=1 Tax=uncultured Litoreibacter sp. TaxID=1392394 RepID=UPI00262548BB|nr:endonuclease/exonuclease/phosphatase family protein [uncultured Litoreibacter sp.]
MRIATYNVEWFSTLFADDGTLVDDDSWSSRRDVTKQQQTAALGAVFQALDADAVMVVEAPDTSPKRDGCTALEHFADRFGLRARNCLIGFTNDTQQEIALLYDPDVINVTHDPKGPATGGKGEAPRFDGVFHIDLDVDDREDHIKFSKPPLEVSLVTKDNQHLRLIGAHLKSKAPHGARNPAAVMRLSIANRRKQLAQCIWLRERVEQHLNAGEDLIVMGDFNDGPGLDEYEELFGRSSVEIVLGVGKDAETRMFDPHAHAALAQRIGAQMATSRFYVRREKRYLNALLDYIMVSPALADTKPNWHIWHPFDDPACWGDVELRDALLTASDHFPVTLDIVLPAPILNT